MAILFFQLISDDLELIAGKVDRAKPIECSNSRAVSEAEVEKISRLVDRLDKTTRKPSSEQ